MCVPHACICRHIFEKILPIVESRVMVRAGWALSRCGPRAAPRRAVPPGASCRGKDDDAMQTVVERELEMNLVLSPERSITVPARLVCRVEDPFAVHIAFHIGSRTPVNWTFARELLVEGVFRPCGHGDV